MAFSIGQLEAIEEAIASGATTVSYEGKSISYGTLDNLLRVRGMIRRSLGLDAAKSATTLVAHDRGF